MFASRQVLIARRALLSAILAASLWSFTSAVAAGGSCGNVDHYTNVSGHCVHRPMRVANQPPGATAKCRDGSYSFSEHHQGTCSHHGGVAVWLR
jgi:hypothetical protein